MEGLVPGSAATGVISRLPPGSIQYQFFHEDVFLKEIEVTSLRTSSFSFSLTAEHSGNYYCTADNGLGAQRSRAVHLSVIGKT